MSAVTIDPATGCLVIGGAKVFPLGLSEAPAFDGQTRDGRNAWSEIASAGVNFVRSGLHDWSLAQIDAQIAAERARMDAAAAHHLYCWPRLGNGKRQVEFAETMPMSTYLVAFIVGPFQFTQAVDVDGIPLRVAAVPGRQHLTGFDDANVRADFRHVRQNVRREENSLAHLRQLNQQLADFNTGAWIKARGRLVQNQHLRIVGKSSGKAQTLLHAATQLIDHIFAAVRQIDQF